MTPQRAKEVLLSMVREEDGDAVTTERLDITSSYVYLSMCPPPDKEVTLDGTFTADQLEAISQWMRDPVSVMNY